MNNDYLNYKKCIDDLTNVLSTAYFYDYSMKTIEKRIVNSKYFLLYNSDFLNSKSYITTQKLLKEIFPEVDQDNIKDFFYNELEWVASLYVNLIKNTNLNFETIFIYIGIDEAIKMYKIYHELDFKDSFIYFNKLRNDQSIINLRMKALKITNKKASEQCGLSISMINQLRNRFRNIKRLDVEHALRLANILKIDVNTLLNN